MNTLTEPELDAKAVAYLPLVRATARATHTTLEYDDRCQEGYFGLRHALERFDAGAGYAFATYARRCIRGYIFNGTVRSCNQYRLPQDHFWKPGLVSQVQLDGLAEHERDSLLGTSSSPETETDSLELRRQLERAMATLSERERKVLSLRYGWDGKEPRTLESIGKRLGVTKEAVRLIQKGAIHKLRFRVPAKLLELLHP